MKSETQHQWGIIILAFFVVCSCSSDDNPQTVDKIKPEVLPKPNLFINFEQNGMVQPSSIEMLGQARIAILDNKLNEVLVFNDLGVCRTFRCNFISFGANSQLQQYLW